MTPVEGLKRFCSPISDLQRAESGAEKGEVAAIRAEWVKGFGRWCATAWFTAAAVACAFATAGFATARPKMGYVFLVLGVVGMMMFFRVLFVIISARCAADGKVEWDK